MLFERRSQIVKALLPFCRYSKPVRGLVKKFATASSRILKAWQLSITFYATLAGVVCTVNLGFTIWACLSFPVIDGVTTLMEGDCSKISQWDTWIHLAINVLSILLLGGSNYTMQCLVAPTRADIDKAHIKGSWLDIGVPSVRNLTGIDPKRSLTWLLLALSSIPLALM